MLKITKLLTIMALTTLEACSNGGPGTQPSTLASLPTPYAGTFYPIYNSGPGQWLLPTESTPFDKVNTIFVAFAHSYPKATGAILDYEAGQVNESANLAVLSQVARQKNPQIKILISLGWGKDDWSYIAQDYKNNANLFVPSVIAFIRNNNLDGFDIDNEDIGSKSGNISQQDFDQVTFNLRQALDKASQEDNKIYYLTVSPAGNNEAPDGIANTQIDVYNSKYFNLINIQTYYDDPEWGPEFANELQQIGYPKNRIAHGINTEKCTPGSFPDHLGYAGLFNWDMTADSVCNNYVYTNQIANTLGL